MVGIVYVNPEGVRVRETERLFKVLQVDVVKYEEKGFDVIVVEFQCKNWTGNRGRSKW